MAAESWVTAFSCTAQPRLRGRDLDVLLAPAPLVGLYDPAGQHCPVRFQPLAGDLFDLG